MIHSNAPAPHFPLLRILIAAAVTDTAIAQPSAPPITHALAISRARMHCGAARARNLLSKFAANA